MIKKLFAAYSFIAALGVLSAFSGMAQAADLNRANWMAAFPDDRPISELIIPGTHDTGAYRITANLGETQDWDIPQQLNNGIRFLDVRIADASIGGYPFEVRHGPLLLGNFHANILTPVYEFLKAHPSETIYMSVKDEAALNKDKFSKEVLHAQNSRFVFSATPETTLGDVRGKIILINRMGTGEGISWGTGTMNIQDNYNLVNNCKAVWWPPFIDCSIDYPKKARDVINQLNAAKADSEYRFWINFASANWKGLYIGNSAAVANPAMQAWFADLNQKIAGGQKIASFGSIIPIDYPNRQGDELITTLLRFNQYAASRGGLMKQLACSEEKNVAGKSGAPVTLHFINHSGKTLKRYLINSSGARQFDGDIANGQTVAINSNVGASWLILDSNGNCHSIRQANSAPLLRAYLK